MIKGHRFAWSASLALALLQGCGGGSDTTALPDTLFIQALEQAEPGVELTFSASAPEGLGYSWEFGDGSRSSDREPRHAYAATGEYGVVLTLSNQAGQTRVVQTTARVRHTSMVSGAACSLGPGQGWCWQRPRPSGNVVQNMFFLDRQAWAVGDAGQILHSSDAGATWQAQYSGVTDRLVQVAFVDATHGWALGEQNTLLHTRDGGANWQAQASGVGNGFIASSNSPLVILDADRAVLFGVFGQTRVTTDGGENWRSVAEPPHTVTQQGTFWRLQGSVLQRSLDLGSSYQTVATLSSSGFISAGQPQFSDPTNGWLLAVDFSNPQPPAFQPLATLWVTSDGGTTWQARPLTGVPANTSIQSVQLFADGSGWLQAFNRVYRTRDGGLSWTEVELPAAGQSSFFVGTRVVGPSALIVFSFDGGTYLTQDGAASWVPLNLPPDLVGFGALPDQVHLRPNGSLWLQFGSRVLSTPDQGRTWAVVFGPASAPSGSFGAVLSALWFHDARRGVALSAGGWVVETQDGGLTWAPRLLTASGSGFGNARLQFQTPSLGWLNLGGTAIYRTTDGGSSWFTPLSTTLQAAIDFQFASESRGWALQSNGGIARTDDGGGNWVAAGRPEFQATGINFLDNQVGVAVGGGGAIARTTDAGTSWSLRPSGSIQTLNRVKREPGGALWAVGEQGTVLRGSDDGLNWTRVPVPSTQALHDIVFADGRHGWVVGSGGTVLATDDGGNSWRVQSSGSNDTLTSVFAVDALTAWITTSSGGVLATASGGR